MKLSRDRIVAEALDLLNEGGLEAVSLRNIAARLSARAPSLARHVGNKQQLIGLMSESLFRSCLKRMPPCSSWQEWLRAFGLSLWQTQSTTRDLASLLAAAPPHPGVLEQHLADLGRSLSGLGVPEDIGIRMQSSVQALITGWTGFRQGPSGEDLSRMIDMEASVRDSLEALILGWEQKISEN